MIHITDQEFERIVAKAMDAMPKEYIENMQNVAFVIENEPSEEQRHRMKLQHNQTLLGLYEGVPLPARGAGYNLILPDKITIFKAPAERIAHSVNQLEAEVRNTVWHEIAHHFGLGHDRIHQIEAEHNL